MFGLCKIKGINITEVWDFRLSTASPLIVRKGGTWVVEIWANKNPDFDGTPRTEARPLEIHDTGIPSALGDELDTKKIKACYRWLKKVRDNYSLPDIEQRKPLVAKINACNKALSEIGAA